MITVEHGIDLLPHVGQVLGVSSWHPIAAADVLQFAEVTGDTHWVHTNPQRAATDGPVNALLVHGFLTLGLVTSLSHECYDVTAAQRWINYGIDRLRFLSPVPAGARVRLQIELLACNQLASDTTRLELCCVLELEKSLKPAFVCTWIVLAFEKG